MCLYSIEEQTNSKRDYPAKSWEYSLGMITEMLWETGESTTRGLTTTANIETGDLVRI